MSRMERRHSGTSAGASKKRTPVDWLKDLATWKKITMLVVLLVLLAILIIGVMLWDTMTGAIDDTRVETPVDYDLSLTAVDGYINILLLGVDSRDMDNIQGTRSDAIMVVSINEETNDVKIISTYRDTYVKMGETPTYDKITHACAYGGPAMTMKTINQIMDLDIENYVVVNFKAVADLVDAVGGITVDVQDFEIQQLNKYTIQTAKNIGREEYQLVESAGLQDLDGCQAVSYSRIRKGVGDDFKRTERMRTVLTKVFSKMKYMSFSDIKALIPMMTPQVQHNLETSDILALASKLPSFNILGSTGWPYNSTIGFIGELSYVLPVDLAANATRLHREMFGQEDYVPSSNLQYLSNELAAKIQAARDSAELEGEEELELEEGQDPTQEGVDITINPETGLPWDPMDPNFPDDILNPETGQPWDPTDPNSPNYDPSLINPDTGLPWDPNDPNNPNYNPGGGTGDGTGTAPDGSGQITDPNNPGMTDPNNPGIIDPGSPGTGDADLPVQPPVTDQPSSGEIQDDPDEFIVYDDPDEQGVTSQGT